MIKRRFYRQEHTDKNDASDSSSSSDSEMEAEAVDESEEDEVAEVNEDNSCSISSGYKSEDSSADEVAIDSSDLPVDEDDVENGNDRSLEVDTQLFGKNSTKILETFPNAIAQRNLMSSDDEACILQCKSVFKCRICPRIICLTEETLRAHFLSKRHIRSQKLLDEGRLKSILNSDGEVENQETAAELHNRIVAVADTKKKNNKGRQRQRKRLKKKTGDETIVEKPKEPAKIPAKKRPKRAN